MFPGPLSKRCFSSLSEEAIPNARRAAKEAAGSLWLTHSGHDLILYYQFSFLLQRFKTQSLTLFLCITLNDCFINAKNTTSSQKRKYTSLVTRSHAVRR